MATGTGSKDPGFRIPKPASRPGIEDFFRPVIRRRLKKGDLSADFFETRGKTAIPLPHMPGPFLRPRAGPFFPIKRRSDC
jgi:hypothetical protein